MTQEITLTCYSLPAAPGLDNIKFEKGASTTARRWDLFCQRIRSCKSASRITTPVTPDSVCCAMTQRMKNRLR